MADITVRIRPDMSMPLENGGYVEGGKTATIDEEYLPKVLHFIEQVPQMEAPSEEPPAEQKPKK